MRRDVRTSERASFGRGPLTKVVLSARRRDYCPRVGPYSNITCLLEIEPHDADDIDVLSEHT